MKRKAGTAAQPGQAKQAEKGTGTPEAAKEEKPGEEKVGEKSGKDGSEESSADRGRKGTGRPGRRKEKTEKNAAEADKNTAKTNKNTAKTNKNAAETNTQTAEPHTTAETAEKKRKESGGAREEAGKITEIRIAPSEKQKEFFRARKKYVAYGGARGGGKSWAVREKARMLGLRYPGIKMLLVRRTYPELEANHIAPLQEMLHGLAKYNQQKKRFTFVNGSTLKLGYCDTDKDAMQYQGQEYDVIFIDEATNLRESWLRKITACMRGVNGYPKRTYYTCNPGGEGHGYIKRLFIERRYEDAENAGDYDFIQALVTDNTALMRSDPSYIKVLDALPGKLRDAWRYGLWDVYEGQFFEDFFDRPEHYGDRRYTHVIDPFEINPRWTIYRSFDWGYSKPFSCGWWAVDFDGVLYRILELYGCGRDANEGVKWTAQKVFAEIRRVENEHPWLKGKEIIGVADPAIWGADSGPSIAEEAARQRVYFSKGDHARIPGWMQCHYRLAFDAQGFPRMYVFKNCRAFIRTIPLLMYDEHVPEDLDTEGEDHVADEWRYMCMARPIKPAMMQGNNYDVKGMMVDPLASEK